MMAIPGDVTLQHVVFDDAALAADPALYLRTDAVRCQQDGLHFKAGGKARFDTWFNALGIGKWARECHLDGVFLALRGRGEFALEVSHVTPEGQLSRLLACEIALDGRGERRLDLSACLALPKPGLIHFSLGARGPGHLAGARYLTRAAPTAWPHLAIVITTFQRVKEVRQTVTRLTRYLAQAEQGAQMRLFLVDNDRAGAPDVPGLCYLPNPNLGGAGGFARGLLEAKAAGCSHCLFMDDDAAFGMENIHRTHVFLALNRHREAAVAGAMISNANPAHLWENGAVFDRRCRPVSGGADLRDPEQLWRIEARALAEKPPGFYGGWWFFAFPLAGLRHYPFPFFVRGDDINFALANRFRISTLLGVASFQDDFADKESPLTLYLDLRNHLVQHLTIPALRIGRFGCAGIALWFILRNAVKFQYETCDALLLAWQDVMVGPRFFTDNADMAARRAAIAALTRQERFSPLPQPRRAPRHWFAAHRWRYIPLRPLWRLSLNGHLLPFYGLWANQVEIPARARSSYRDVWGSACITYLDASGTRGYKVGLSRRRFLWLMARCGATWLRFVLGYGALRSAYGQAYGQMTSRRYWRRLLGLERTP